MDFPREILSKTVRRVTQLAQIDNNGVWGFVDPSELTFTVDPEGNLRHKLENKAATVYEDAVDPTDFAQTGEVGDYLYWSNDELVLISRRLAP